MVDRQIAAATVGDRAAGGAASARENCQVILDNAICDTDSTAQAEKQCAATERPAMTVLNCNAIECERNNTRCAEDAVIRCCCRIALDDHRGWRSGSHDR